MGFYEINIARNTDTYSEVLCGQTRSCTIDLRRNTQEAARVFRSLLSFSRRKLEKKINFFMVTEQFRPVNTPKNLTDLVCCVDAES